MHHTKTLGKICPDVSDVHNLRKKKGKGGIPLRRGIGLKKVREGHL